MKNEYLDLITQKKHTKILGGFTLLFMTFLLTMPTLFAQTGTIKTHVWNDKDGDGKQDDSNANLVDVTVELYDAVTQSVIMTDETNASGDVTFSNVPAGTSYKLRYLLPTNHKFTSRKAGGTATHNDSDVHPSGTKKATTDAFNLADGQTLTTVDCGMWAPGSVEVRVWNDKDGDGKQDDNLANLDGVTVELLDVNQGNALLASGPTSGGKVTLFPVPEIGRASCRERV